MESFISLKKFYLLSSVYLTAYNVKGTARALELVKLLVVMTALTGVYGLAMNMAGLQARLLAVQGMAMTSGGIFMIAGLLMTPYYSKTGLRAAGFFIITAIIMGSLILTKTVSAWLGWASGALFLLFIKKKYLIACLAVISAAGILVLALKPSSAGFFTYRKMNTWEARLTTWRIGWQLIKERPFLGTGLIDLGELYQAKRTPEDIRLHGNNRRLGHLHNNFIHIAATMGIIGLLAFISMWIIIIKNMAELVHISHGSGRAFSAGLLSVVIAFLINGMAEWNFGDSEVITIVWFIIGISLSMSNELSGKLDSVSNRQ